MKSQTNSPATIFTNGRFPKGAMHTGSNKAPLAVTAGKILIECPVCSLHVLKPAAWVRRPGRSNFFCGKGCADEFKRIRLLTACVVCEKEFFVTPSNLSRIITCSTACKAEKMRVVLLNKPMANPPSRIKGNHSGVKLTELQVSEIRLIKGKTQAQIARDYSVSQSLVSFIQRGPA